jgi:hypothetical protein
MGSFFPIMSNHRRWKWEQSSPTTIVENIFIPEHQQRQYTITEARAGREHYVINTNDFEWINDWINNGDAKSGYPLDPTRQSVTTKTFLKPTIKHLYNLKKEDTIVTSKFIQTDQILGDMRTVRLGKMNLHRTRITISMTSK